MGRFLPLRYSPTHYTLLLLIRIILFLAALLSLNRAHAQHWLGLTPSNYAGVNGIYQQPAQVADSRHRLSVSLLGVDGYGYNNYVRWNAPYPIWRFGLGMVPAQFHNANGDLGFSPANLAERLNGGIKKGFAGGEIRGPGLMISSRTGRWGIGITSRVRAGGAVTNTSEPLAQFIRVGLPGSQVLPMPRVTAQHGTVNFSSYGEIGLTLGYVIRTNDEHFWKVGASLKRLVGLYNVHLAVTDASYNLIPDPDMPGLTALAIQQWSGSYGYTTEDSYKSPSGSWLFGRGAPGTGWGVDLGVVYEYRPDARRYRYTENGEQLQDGSRNKYRYRLSASLTDVGMIRYNNPTYVTQYDQLSSSNRPLTHRSFQGVQNADAFFYRIETILGADHQQRQTAFRAVLPTALNLSADYKIDENVYVNATLVQPLLSPAVVGLYRPAVIAVTPRYELPQAEVSLPISWQGNYANLCVGLALRLGPVVVGTDHLPGLLSVGRPRGGNLYLSTSIPLLRPAPRDPLACYVPGVDASTRRKGLFRR